MPGPVVVMPGGGSPEAVRLAAEVAAGYSKTREGASAKVSATAPEGETGILVVVPARDEIRNYLI